MPKLTMQERFARLEAERMVKPEPKWGTERRRKIVQAMADPANRHRKHDVITFTRKVCRAHDLRHFLDEIATETDMQNVERILGL